MEQGIGVRVRGRYGWGLQLPAVMVLAAGIGALVGSAQAQPVPDYDFDWAVIGDPGNRLPTDAEIDGELSMPYGSVGYRYRISKKETTATQWIDFVRAYSPFWQGDPGSPSLTGFWISYDYGSGAYSITDNAYQAPIATDFYLAARYTNWLHNGKVNEAWAFETGAYDMTGSNLPQRSEDARFWIPSYDEWVKAMHYDPNRYGEGEGGYWSYPNASNDFPVSGRPEDGGETNAGLIWGIDGIFWDVGSYPDVQSPWGLLDGSGGVSEQTDTLLFEAFIQDGSFFGYGVGYTFVDNLNWNERTIPFASSGLRIAGIVPAPASSTVGIGLFVITFFRRKRT